MGWEQIAAAASGPIGAGISAIGQASANETNLKIAADTREFNSREAAIARDWQQGMSATAYQRAMADMKAAGLNPMSAFSQGGASVGSGSTASSSNTSVDSELGGMGETLSRAVQSALQVEQIEAGIRDTNARAQLNEVEAQVSEHTRRKEAANARTAEMAEKVIKAAQPARIKEAQNEATQADQDRRFQTFDNWIRRLQDTAGVVGSALGGASKYQGMKNRAEQINVDKLRAFEAREKHKNDLIRGRKP